MMVEGEHDDHPHVQLLVLLPQADREVGLRGSQVMTAPKTDLCHRCHATIYLAPTGIRTTKWVTNLKKARQTWKCGNDPAYPVRAHAPQPHPARGAK
jgi:hypothetical protein